MIEFLLIVLSICGFVMLWWALVYWLRCVYQPHLMRWIRGKVDR